MKEGAEFDSAPIFLMSCHSLKLLGASSDFQFVGRQSLLQVALSAMDAGLWESSGALGSSQDFTHNDCFPCGFGII